MAQKNQAVATATVVSYVQSISQGSVATHLRCGVILTDNFPTYFLLSLKVSNGLALTEVTTRVAAFHLFLCHVVCSAPAACEHWSNVMIGTRRARVTGSPLIDVPDVT